MTYWEIKLAVTCLFLLLTCTFAFSTVPDVEHYYRVKTFLSWVIGTSAVVLFILVLWCIWHPPAYLVSDGNDSNPLPLPPRQTIEATK
jgi:fumarate reductase subunit D